MICRNTAFTKSCLSFFVHHVQLAKKHFIRVKRDTEKELHKEYNQKMIKSLKINSADDKITFISQYTPLIFAKLNKADINALAESHEVESLYDMDSEPIDDDGLNFVPKSYQSNNRDTESYYTYDRKQFIRYTPQQAGTYKIKVERISVPGSSPAYYPEFALSYYII